ncbi:hypothetical protein M1146_07570, partial [Patescibacteria group bacterium]|nr:hypothetical protein [Patescibacteria group bacterium]
AMLRKVNSQILLTNKAVSIFYYFYMTFLDELLMTVLYSLDEVLRLVITEVVIPYTLVPRPPPLYVVASDVVDNGRSLFFFLWDISSK